VASIGIAITTGLSLLLAFYLSCSLSRQTQSIVSCIKDISDGKRSVSFPPSSTLELDTIVQSAQFLQQQLEQEASLREQWMQDISHDLRTPLTMIVGYSEVMRDIPGENTPENVQVIIDETQRLTELVNDMLDLSKIKAGTRKPEFELFDLTETVAAVMLRYEKFTESKNYNITFNANESVMVRADRTMILQVVYNLVNNAINYTGEDGNVIITQTVFGGKVRISVADTGVGIAEEDIPYIWDRYYKVDKVHKRAKVGTGLGLSIVKGILESHGATYGVESRMGEGSNFWFELETFRDATVIETKEKNKK
jgi:signal transduction histidine kinase